MSMGKAEGRGGDGEMRDRKGRGWSSVTRGSVWDRDIPRSALAYCHRSCILISTPDAVFAERHWHLPKLLRPQQMIESACFLDSGGCDIPSAEHDRHMIDHILDETHGALTRLKLHANVGVGRKCQTIKYWGNPLA